MEKIVKRGYVKWTDEDGVFHKEPLANHPDLLASASPEEQLRAEEVRRLNAAAKEAVEEREDTAEQDTKEALAELKKAPEDVLTVSQLNGAEPASAAEEPVVDEDHDAILAKLRESSTAD